MDSQRHPGEQECEKQVNAIEQQKVYFPATIEFSKELSVSFNKEGKVLLKQGKHLITTSIDDFHKIEHIANVLTDYKAMLELQEQQYFQRELERSKEQVNHLEENLKESKSSLLAR